MKFAYLILAHNNFKTLQHLVKMLDDSRNDIFVEIDKKVSTLPQLQTIHSKLYFVNDRIDVRWGHYSQIQAYVELFREASQHGEYDFYHLISGTTLPLKDQSYIHEHFSRLPGANVFRMWPKDEGDADFKLRRIHFWIKNFQSRKPWLKWAVQHIWTANMLLQKKLGIRINKKENYYKSDCWVSLSKSGVKYLLDNEKAIIGRYRFSFAGDEYYMLSEMKKSAELTIVDDQDLLFVDFDFDHPRTLSAEEYRHLSESDYLFARKFDDSIIDAISDMKS